MRDPQLTVLKFGGSVLTEESTLAMAVDEIHRWRREGQRVIAVVSALAGATDDLLVRSRCYGHHPASESVAALVSLGELESAALLGLHLDRAGVRASVLTPQAIGLIADGPALDATPIGLDVSAMRRVLERDGVAVIPGFVARDADGRTVLLGRGGSDLTALFIAACLGAGRCRLIKDVDGLYDRDPAGEGPPPQRYAIASWADALATDGSIVQHKAVRCAQAHDFEFELGSLNGSAPTRIGPGPTRLCPGLSSPARAPGAGPRQKRSWPMSWRSCVRFRSIRPPGKSTARA